MPDTPENPKSKTEIAGTPTNPAVLAMQSARQHVPGDIVNRVTQDLPDTQRSAIRRFHAHYIEEGLTLSEAAKLINKEAATLSLIFNGRYGAKLDNVVEEINAFLQLHDKRSQSRRLPFIHTKLSRRIWSICDTALELQKVGFIFGDGQIGKTEALKSFALEHNHGSTVYLEVPAGGSLMDFITVAAEKLRISPQQRIPILRRRIINSFDHRMLLIVDELSRTVDAQARARAIQTIEFIREIFNERQCGLVLCATNTFRDEMESGTLHKILNQLKRRRFCALQLDSRPTKEDLNIFAAAYHLPPATGESLKLQTTMIEAEALGMWLTLLRMAAKLAGQRKQTMTWPHVLTAHSALKELEGR